jgi:pimeloyl-ACP methyl ester carboxylesterase
MGHYFRQDYLHVPDGASLYFQVQGEGLPGMLLCDGLGCDGFAWKYLAPYLVQQHRVVRWHYRGHGRSTCPADRTRIGMFYTCDDLRRVMDAAGLERAVLFGHSMGVQVALEFHRRFSHRVQGLVLLCGSYGTPLDTFHDSPLLKRVFPWLRQLVERFPTRTARLTRALLSTELAMQVALSVELNRDLIQRADLEPYFEHLARMDPVVFVRTLDSLASHSAWDHLPHVDVPTLVIGGERDKFTPAWLSRKMAAQIPGAELMMVPQGSHTAPLESPQLVELRVERFLRERLRLPVPPPSRPETHV